MIEYKVENLMYYSKLTLYSKHIANDSKKKFKKLDKYAAKGYWFTNSTATNFGAEINIHVYFEKDL